MFIIRHFWIGQSFFYIFYRVVYCLIICVLITFCMLRVERVLTVCMVVMWSSMCFMMSLMFVLNYFDNVADGIGESDIMVVRAVVTASSWTRRSSEIIIKLLILI